MAESDLVIAEVLVYTHIYATVYLFPLYLGDARMMIARKRVLLQSSYGKGAIMARRIIMPFLPARASIACPSHQ